MSQKPNQRHAKHLKINSGQKSPDQPSFYYFVTVDFFKKT